MQTSKESKSAERASSSFRCAVPVFEDSGGKQGIMFLAETVAKPIGPTFFDLLSANNAQTTDYNVMMLKTNAPFAFQCADAWAQSHGFLSAFTLFEDNARQQQSIACIEPNQGVEIGSVSADDLWRARNREPIGNNLSWLRTDGAMAMRCAHAWAKQNGYSHAIPNFRNTGNYNELSLIKFPISENVGKGDIPFDELWTVRNGITDDTSVYQQLKSDAALAIRCAVRWSLEFLVEKCPRARCDAGNSRLIPTQVPSEGEKHILFSNFVDTDSFVIIPGALRIPEFESKILVTTADEIDVSLESCEIETSPGQVGSLAISIDQRVVAQSIAYSSSLGDGGDAPAQGRRYRIDIGPSGLGLKESRRRRSGF